MPRFFASDNAAQAHPEVLAALRALAEHPGNHQRSYGDDEQSAECARVLTELFVDPGSPSSVESWLVFNGTAANVVALSSCALPGEAVICAAQAHIHEDEGGAAEALAGLKLILVPTRDGKLRPADLLSHLAVLGNVHHAQPTVVSLTQSTELGTVYTPQEISALAQTCHSHGLILHLDGARISNAVAWLCEQARPDAASLPAADLRSLAVGQLRAITVDAGVDIFSLGGTKNGLLAAEAIVTVQRAPGSAPAANGAAASRLESRLEAARRRLPFVRKTFLQLASKMRYLAVQMACLYGGVLWVSNALHANSLARRLEQGIRDMTRRHGVWLAQHPAGTDDQGNVLPHLLQPVQANAAFVRFPAALLAPLVQSHFFHTWADDHSGRVMTSWDSRPEDIDAFLATLDHLLVGLRGAASLG